MEAVQRCRRCKQMKPLSSFAEWNVPRCKDCIQLQVDNWKMSRPPPKKKPRKRTKKVT